MMSTLVRPSSRYDAFSRTATSPVRNQPSRNAADVSSGRFQYSRKTDGPRTSSSPGVPVSTSCPASSTSLTSTPGSGMPTHPGRRSPVNGFESAMPISVMPYRSSSVWPLISRHRSSVFTGSAADPDIMSRSPRTASARCVRMSGVAASPRCDQPVVNRRHGREHSHFARRQPLPHTFGVEGRQDLARRSHRKRRAEAIDDAVHVVQREYEQ